MKKIILVLLTAILLSPFTGCKPRENIARIDNGKINVITTIFAPYDFVRQIAGDRVNLTMLLHPGSESHSFEASPRDIISIQNSDVFIYIGGESDSWVDRILESMDTANIKILAMLDAVEAVKEEIVEGMEDDDHDHDDEHGSFWSNFWRRITGLHKDNDHDDDEEAFDEHVWTSPKNAIILVEKITEMLCEADPVNADFFKENANAYIEQLQELDDTFKEITDGAKRRTIVFGDRFPFRYFADAYDLEYFAAFPGCSTETEPSAATVAFLIDKIKQEEIPVVFHIKLSNERMADTISAETGAKKMLLHSCHNITKREFDAGSTYLDFMRNNTEALREALY